MTSRSRRAPIAIGVLCAITAAICVAAAPARAATQIAESCSVGRFDMSAHTKLRSSGSNWVLSDTRYRLSGGARRRSGGRGRKYGFSNLNFEIVSDGEVVFSSYSPDTRVADGRRYRIRHRTRVPKDAATFLSFEAIFDVPWSGDPRCFATSAELPLVIAPEPEPEPEPVPAPVPPATTTPPPQAPPPSLLDRILPPRG